MKKPKFNWMYVFPIIMGLLAVAILVVIIIFAAER
jgi:Mg2+ and Co2+ transporter CorA